MDGKTWKIAAICGRDTRRWAWLVNIKNKTEQVRLSMNSAYLEGTS